MVTGPKCEAALALHRFGFGPRVGLIAAITADPRGALLADIERPGTGALNASGMHTSGEAARAAFKAREARRTARLAERAEREASEASTAAGGTALANRLTVPQTRARRAKSRETESSCRRISAELSRRSQGPHRSRA